MNSPTKQYFLENDLNAKRFGNSSFFNEQRQQNIQDNFVLIESHDVEDWQAELENQKRLAEQKQYQFQQLEAKDERLTKETMLLRQRLESEEAKRKKEDQ